MYEIELLPNAEDDLDKLDPPLRLRIQKRFKWVADHFDGIRPEALSGSFAEFYKIRIGDYRALYQFNHTQRKIVVFRVRHRREVYE